MGQRYLDIDITSFRFIVSVLGGVSSLQYDTQKLSSIDLALIQSTARYLMLDSMCEDIGKIQAGFEKEMQVVAEQSRQAKAGFEKEDRRREVESKALQEKVLSLEKKANELDSIHKSLEAVDVRTVNCVGKQTGRSHNQCGCVSMIIGPLDLEQP